jgi:hypothetical protein
MADSWDKQQPLNPDHPRHHIGSAALGHTIGGKILYLRLQFEDTTMRNTI